jgi:hypothetical protein
MTHADFRKKLENMQVQEMQQEEKKASEMVLPPRSSERAKRILPLDDSLSKPQLMIESA